MDEIVWDETINEEAVSLSKPKKEEELQTDNNVNQSNEIVWDDNYSIEVTAKQEKEESKIKIPTTTTEAINQEFDGKIASLTKQMEEIEDEDTLNQYNVLIAKQVQSKQDKLAKAQKQAELDYYKSPIMGGTEQEQPFATAGSTTEYSQEPLPTKENDLFEKQKEQRRAKVELFVSGAKKLPIGFSVIAGDLLSKVPEDMAGFDTDQLANWASKWARQNKKAIDDLNDEAGYTGDEIFTPQLFGEIFAEGITLAAGGAALKGFGWANKALSINKAALVEAGLATTTAKGEIVETTDEFGMKTEELSSYPRAIKEGVMAGIVTKVGGEFIDTVGKVINDPAILRNLISGKSSDKEALQYAIDKSGETDANINKFYTEYANSIDKNISELSDAEKTIAIVNKTDMGTAIKVEAEYYNDGVIAKINNSEQQLREIIAKSTEGGGFDFPAIELKEYAENSGKIYEDVKNVLLDNFNDAVKINKSSTDELISLLEKSSMKADDIPIVKAIITDLKKAETEGLSVERLLSMKQDLNGLNLSSTKGFKAGEVGKFIDKQIEAGVGKEAFTVWKEVNKRYAAKILMQSDNPIGQLLTRATDKNVQISPQELADKILSMENKGYNTLNNLRQVIGEKSMTDIEKGIVKNIFNQEGLDTADAVKAIESFQFSTVEGRSMQQQLDKAKGYISNKDAKSLLRRIIGTRIDSVGLSDDLLAKLKYTIAGRVWNGIMKRTGSGSEERVLTTIGDILKGNDAKFIMDLKKDKAYQKAFQEEQIKLKKSIENLKQKGKAKTAKENKELADKIALEKELARQSKLPAVQTVQAKEYNPNARQVGTQEDIIDVDATRNYTVGTDGRISDQYGNIYDTVDDVPSSSKPLPMGIESSNTGRPKYKFYNDPKESKSTAYLQSMKKTQNKIKNEKYKAQQELQKQRETKNQSAIDFDNMESLELEQDAIDIKIDLKNYPTQGREKFMNVKVEDSQGVVTDVLINKGQFDAIKKYHKTNKSGRVAIKEDNKMYGMDESVVDRLKDVVDFEEIAKEANPYPNISDFMNKKELGSAKNFASGKDKSKEAKAAYDKYKKSSETLNRVLEETEEEVVNPPF